MADRSVRGYAVLWDELSENLGGFRERFRKGAFRESLADGGVKFMVRSHDLARPVASTSSGTLELEEDAIGLRFTAKLPDNGDAGDLAATIKRRVLTKMSFAFSTERAADETFANEGGQLVRTVKRAQLFEVSPVTFPAYPQTSVRAALDEGEKPKTKRSTKGKRKAIMARRVASAEAKLPKPKPQRPEARKARHDLMLRRTLSRS